MTMRKVSIDLVAEPVTQENRSRAERVAAMRAITMAARRSFHELVRKHGLTDVSFPLADNDTMFPVIVVTASEESISVIATFPIVAAVHEADALHTQKK